MLVAVIEEHDIEPGAHESRGGRDAIAVLLVGNVRQHLGEHERLVVGTLVARAVPAAHDAHASPPRAELPREPRDHRRLARPYCREVAHADDRRADVVGGQDPARVRPAAHARDGSKEERRPPEELDPPAALGEA